MRPINLKVALAEGELQRRGDTQEQQCALLDRQTSLNASLDARAADLDSMTCKHGCPTLAIGKASCGDIERITDTVLGLSGSDPSMTVVLTALPALPHTHSFTPRV